MKSVCTVLSVSEGRAELLRHRPDACDTCRGCNACGKEVVLWAADPIGVSVGDRVEVSDRESSVLFMCAVLFFLPVFLGIGALLLCSVWLSPATSAVAGVLVFALAFVGATLFLRKKKGDSVQIERVLAQGEKE